MARCLLLKGEGRPRKGDMLYSFSRFQVYLGQSLAHVGSHHPELIIVTSTQAFPPSDCVTKLDSWEEEQP